MVEQAHDETKQTPTGKATPEKPEVTFEASRKLFVWNLGVSIVGTAVFGVFAGLFFAEHDAPFIGGLAVALGGAFLSLALTFVFRIVETVQRKDNADQFDKLYRALAEKIDGVKSCTCGQDLSRIEEKAAQLKLEVSQIKEDVRGVYAQVDTLRTDHRWQPRHDRIRSQYGE